MDFISVLPYLPCQVLAAYTIYQREDKDGSGRYQLISTAFAVAGYIAARQLSGRFGLTLSQCAVFGLFANFPGSIMVLCGHLFVQGIKQAVEAGYRRDALSLISNIALASFAYFRFTPKYNQLIFRPLSDWLYGRSQQITTDK